MFIQFQYCCCCLKFPDVIKIFYPPILWFLFLFYFHSHPNLSAARLILSKLPSFPNTTAMANGPGEFFCPDKATRSGQSISPTEYLFSSIQPFIFFSSFFSAQYFSSIFSKKFAKASKLFRVAAESLFFQTNKLGSYFKCVAKIKPDNSTISDNLDILSLLIVTSATSLFSSISLASPALCKNGKTNLANFLSGIFFIYCPHSQSNFS